MDDERRVRPGRPINFDDSYDDSDNTDDDEEEWVPLLRRQNAIRRRGVGTIEDSFVAYQNPFVEVKNTFVAIQKSFCGSTESFVAYQNPFVEVQHPL